jgi:hypothetical protein
MNSLGLYVVSWRAPAASEREDPGSLARAVRPYAATSTSFLAKSMAEARIPDIHCRDLDLQK